MWLRGDAQRTQANRAKVGLRRHSLKKVTSDIEEISLQDKSENSSTKVSNKSEKKSPSRRRSGAALSQGDRLRQVKARRHTRSLSTKYELFLRVSINAEFCSGLCLYNFQSYLNLFSFQIFKKTAKNASV